MADIYGATALTGGGATALDSIDGNDLSDGDAATVITDAGVYWYHLNATSAATENSPFRIAPDSNAGDKRWHLVGTTARIGALVTRTSDLSISSSSTATTISFQEATYDDADFWESVTNPSRLSVPIGVTSVRLSGNAAFYDNDVASRLYMAKNGSGFTGSGQQTCEVSSYLWTHVVSSIVETVGGTDYFELKVSQESTGAQDLKQSTYLAIEAVGFA